MQLTLMGIGLGITGLRLIELNALECPELALSRYLGANFPLEIAKRRDPPHR